MDMLTLCLGGLFVVNDANKSRVICSLVLCKLRIGCEIAVDISNDYSV